LKLRDDSRRSTSRSHFDHRETPANGFVAPVFRDFCVPMIASGRPAGFPAPSRRHQ
jgi:hypothetical protein